MLWCQKRVTATTERAVLGLLVCRLHLFLDSSLFNSWGWGPQFATSMSMYNWLQHQQGLAHLDFGSSSICGDWSNTVGSILLAITCAIWIHGNSIVRYRNYICGQDPLVPRNAVLMAWHHSTWRVRGEQGKVIMSSTLYGLPKRGEV